MVNMLHLIIVLVISGGLSADAANRILAGDRQPVDHGDVGAGEGPAWHPDGCLLFTGRGRITKWEPAGKVSIFREDSGAANGLLFDQEGRLVTCESGRRRVTRTERDGRITVLADNYAGSRFNTPNDLTIDSQGRIYFTDPRYGSREGMEMRDENGRPIEGVYRIDAPGRVSRIIAGEVERPNGILVASRDRYLFVADNNNNNKGGARKLWRFDLKRDGSVDLRSRTLIFDWKDARGPDGLKMDREGRLYVAAGVNVANAYETADKLRAGIYVLSPRGRLLAFIPIAHDEVTNCAFGGADFRTLFVTAGGHLWSMQMNTPGTVAGLSKN
jgi:gluconolactonase